MKKYCAIVLTFILCLAFANISLAANFADVNGTKYESAVNYLVDLGVINGYPDNTFRPDGAVTRAEVAKMIITVTQNQETSISNNVYFEDVEASNHWAKTNIYIAATLGIVNGYGDWTFGPDGNVTYAEVSAMVIRAMGYDNDVQAIGLAWPTNYISYGEELDLYESIDSFDANSQATRGNVAIMLYNMLKSVPQDESDNYVEDDSLDESKTLIAYFSHASNTEAVAQLIKENTDADLFEIKTENSYPENYEETAKQEKESNARPKLSTHVSNMNDYDVIFIGYPIWLDTTPMAIRTFLEEYDFEGKLVIPFCINNNDGLGSSVDDIVATVPEANVLDGLSILESEVEGKATSNTVKDWIQELAL